MQSARFVGLIVCLLSLSPSLAPPATRANDRYVMLGGTGDGSSWGSPLPTVTAALQVATEGDTVYVWAGVYPERITLKSGVTLIGGYLYVNGQIWWMPQTATLDGDNAGPVVTIETGAVTSTTLAGFVLRNGSGTRILHERETYGGGICCVDASPTLLYNLVIGCHADRGGGIVLYTSSPERGGVVKDCVIQNNQARTGGGVYCLRGAATLTGCAIRGNTADESGGGLAGSSISDVLVSDCVFEANRAGTLGNAVSLIKGIFRNNTVLRNAGLASGAVAVPYGSGVTVANSIIAFNSSGICTGFNVTASLHHNDVFGNTAGNYIGVADPTGTDGNISKDPALEDPLFGIYTPCPGSPCVDKGDDTVVPTGQEDYHDQARCQGVCVDIGASEWPQPASRPAIRVSPNGDDGNTGESWDKPKQTISAAVASAIAAGREVWVAVGTYVENISISNANVMLYGGFAGNETARNLRDPENNPTIVRPSLAVSVFSLTNVDRNTVIDGFTIRASDWGFGVLDGMGGGIHVNRGTPVISGNTIENFSLDTNVLEGGKGGGIYIDNGAVTSDTPPVIACNTIRNNQAEYGGGLGVYRAFALIRNNRFTLNEASWRGYYTHGTGGAIYLEGSSGYITGNVIRANSAPYGTGGGIVCQRDGLTPSSVTIRGNRIEDNSVYRYGGAIACRTDDAQILNNRITGNRTADRTGGIAGSGNATIANNVIAENEVYMDDGSVAWGNGNLELINNTITSGYGAVRLEVTGSTTGAYTFHVANNIVAHTRAGVTGKVNIESTVTLSNNCFFDTTADYVGVSPGPGDMHADPRFRDETARDYRLRPGSPCVDAALDGAAIGQWDVAGWYRLQGGHVDIGAWESASWSGAMIPSVIGALRIAGGLQVADDPAIAELDVVHSGAGGCIDILDAIRLARRAAGLE